MKTRSKQSVSTVSKSSKSIMIPIFEKRKDGFISSLKKILESVAGDKLINQMFEDRASVYYVPERICEIVNVFLNSDREKTIEQLIFRISMVEACFGDRIKLIERIGFSILDLINDTILSQEMKQERLKSFYQQLARINIETMIENNFSNPHLLITDVVRSIFDIRSSVESLTNLFMNVLSDSRSRLRVAIISHQRDYLLKEKELESKMEEIQYQFLHVDIPKIQKRYEDEIDRYQKNEAVLHKEMTKIRNGKERTVYRCSQLEMEIETLKNQIASLSIENENSLMFGDEIGNLKKNVFELEEELLIKRNQVDALIENKLDQLSIDESLKLLLKSMQNDIKKKENQVIDLKSENKAYHQKLIEAEKDISLYRADGHLNQSKIAISSTIENSRRQLYEQMKKLDMEKTKLEMKFNETTSLLAEYQEENSSLKMEISDLTTKLSKNREISSKLTDLENQSIVKDSSLRLKDEEIKEMAKQNVILTSKIRQIENNLLEYKSKQSDFDSIVEQKENEMNDINSMLQSSQNEIRMLKQQIDLSNSKSSEVINLLKKKNEELNDEILNLSQMNHSKDVNQQELESRLNECEMEHKRLIDRFNDINKKNNDINQELQNKEKTIQHYVTMEENTRKKLNAFNESSINDKKIFTEQNEKLSSLSIMNGELRGKIAELEQSMNVLTNKLNEKQEKIDDLKKEIQLLNSTIEKSCSRIQEYENTIVGQKTVISTQKAQIETLILENTTTKTQKDSSIADKDDIIKAINKEKQTLIKEKQQMISERTRLLSQIDEITKEKNQYMIIIEKAKTKAQGLDQELKRKNDEIQLLKKKSLEEIAHKDQALKIEKEKHTEEMKQIKINNEEKRKLLTDQKAEVEIALQAEISKVLEFSSKMDSYESELNALKVKNQSLQMNIRKLESNVAENMNERETLSNKVKNIAQVKSLSQVPTILKEQNQQIAQQDQFIQSIMKRFNINQSSDLEKAFSLINEKCNDIEEIEDIIGEITNDHTPSVIITKTNEISDFYQGIMASYPDLSSQDVIGIVLEQKKVLDEFEDMLECDGISSLLSIVQNMNDSLSKISEFYPNQSPNEFIYSTIKSLEFVQKLRDHFGNEVSPDGIIQTSSLLNSVKSILSIIDNNAILGEVSRLCFFFADCKSIFLTDNESVIKSKIIESNRILTEIMDLYHVSNPRDLMPLIQKSQYHLESIIGVFPECSDLFGAVSNINHQFMEIKSSLGCLDDQMVASEALRKLSKLQALEKEQESILNSFNAPNFSQLSNQFLGIQKENFSLREMEGEILNIFPEYNRKVFPEQFTRILNENRLFIGNEKELMNILNIDTPSSIIKMTKKLMRYASILMDIKSLVNCSKLDGILSIIQSLINSKNELESFSMLIPGQGSVMQKMRIYVNKYNDMEKSRIKIGSLIEKEYGEDLGKAVEQLKKDLNNAADLFSRLFAVLSTPASESLKLTFPLSDPVKETFLGLISEFKSKTDETTMQINNIVSKAMQHGFIGSKVEEAAEYIANWFVGIEKQKILETLNDELNSLRQSNSQMLEIESKRKERLQKRIDEQKSTIDQISQKLIEKEKEYLDEIEEQKRQHRQASYTLEKEKKVREELIRALSGKVIDRDFLKLNLTPDETRVLNILN